jgi:hypothetical protein
VSLCIILSVFSIFSVSAEEYDPYEDCLNQINEMYNLDLGYNKVNPDEISLEDYKLMVEQLGEEQRKTLDNMEERSKSASVETSLNLAETITQRSSSYTISETKNYSSWAKISCTFTCYPSTQTVGNPTDVAGWATIFFTSQTGRRFYQESWDYVGLDQNETLAITIYGYTNGLGGKIDNVVIYGEFYYQ